MVNNINVPQVDVTRQYKEAKEIIDKTVSDTLSSGAYILGKEVQALEEKMAGYTGVNHSIGVASGTDAIFLILKALGIGPGDEVITTPFTFIATADTISNCGGRPVFADIDPKTFNIDPAEVEKKLTDRTRAVIVVHLFGQSADMDPLMDIAESRSIDLIEDCAQSQGAEYKGTRVGSFGAASAFSFFPTKNLSCAGDGGAVCTNDDELAVKVRMLRAHGSRKKYEHELLGINSRLDALQAAMLNVKFSFLDRWNEERIETAEYYNRNMKGVVTPYVLPDTLHVYNQYTIRSNQRDRMKQKLQESGVGNAIYYSLPLHLQACYRDLGYSRGDFPESENASAEVLSLPMFPGITQDEKDSVCKAVNSLV